MIGGKSAEARDLFARRGGSHGNGEQEHFRLLLVVDMASGAWSSSGVLSRLVHVGCGVRSVLCGKALGVSFGSIAGTPLLLPSDRGGEEPNPESSESAMCLLFVFGDVGAAGEVGGTEESGDEISPSIV